MSFLDTLNTTTDRQHSLLCVGLDTVPDRLPDILRKEDNPVLTFNTAIIEATSDLVAAYKINTAFYEQDGSQGWETLERTLDAIPDTVIKILDAKRGDIGNTARMYAKAVFETLGADAVTVNPYLGGDAVEPFIEYSEKGTFVLCLTSNPGSRDFQHVSDGNETLYQLIARTVQGWNRHQNCGLVVGATHPEQLKEIRERTPDLPFLIPGLGAQGGDLESSVRYGTDERGGNALYNSSRGILYASSGADFADAARQQARAMNDAINGERTKGL
jgi:orotidine-5'-phosphate decarboxylase